MRERPLEFSGLGFARLQGLPGKDTKHQSVTINPDSLAFGPELNACPGRLFALYKVNAVLLELTLRYDIRLVGDVDGRGGRSKRPKQIP